MNPAVSSVTAFFPCYNDAPVIGSLIEAVHEVLRESVDDFEVVVVDDGSEDDSVAVLHEVAARLPNVRVVVHPRNRGYGGALRSGFAAATRDWVFYTDGDGQYDPRELKLLVDAGADDVDVVQGYKVRRGDGVARTAIGVVWHQAVAVLFGLPVRDTDCDFRLIRRPVVQALPFESNSGVFPVELVWRLKTAGARFVEVPVHHYARAHGRSQFFRPLRILATFRDLGLLWWRLVARRRLGRDPGPGGGAGGRPR
jgi:glycosyltransferase involved in cell wall biosynthesis